MKTIGVKKFRSIKYKTLPLEGKWKDTLGEMPPNFQMLIYGGNGNGKTEFVMQLSAELTKYGQVEVVNYESGHGADFQRALMRNFPENYEGKILFSDPHEKKDPNKTYCKELDERMSRRRAAQFWIIDSVDACMMNAYDYQYLKKKHGKSKGIIWLSYEQQKDAKTMLARNIGGEGHYKIRVCLYIAYVQKNRFESATSGRADYIIYEQRARELNPMYKAWAVPEPVKRGKQLTKRAKKRKEL